MLKSKSGYKALGPWRITFDTNPDQCNQQCIMCEEHSPYRKTAKPSSPRVMPISLLQRVVEEAVPMGLREIIPSTMGEPLLYEDFEEILDLCHRHDLKLNLTTNGTFPRLGAKVWAEKLVPVASDIKISWNGASQEIHEKIMVGSDWEQALRNVKTLIAVRDQHAVSGGKRCRITFQTTFLEENISELSGLVALAIELGVDRVKGHHLWCHFDEIQNLSMRRNSDAIMRWNKAVAEATEVASGHDIVLENILPLKAGAIENLSPEWVCPFLGREAWVSAGGVFSPCCAPDEKRKAFGSFGNLNNYSLVEIWQSDSYQKLTQDYKNHQLCISCNMRRPVEGWA